VGVFAVPLSLDGFSHHFLFNLSDLCGRGERFKFPNCVELMLFSWVGIAQDQLNPGVSEQRGQLARSTLDIADPLAKCADKRRAENDQPPPANSTEMCLLDLGLLGIPVFLMRERFCPSADVSLNFKTAFVTVVSGIVRLVALTLPKGLNR
jgi:hypothetical protein